MRIATTLVLLLSTACSEPPSAIEVATTDASLLDNNAMTVTITMPTDGVVSVALADREDVLDIAKSTRLAGRVELAAKAGEPVTLTLRAHEWSGSDVLRQFVVPLGGSAASDVVVAAVPGFEKAGLVEIAAKIASGSRATSSTMTFPAPHHMTTRSAPSGLVEAGAPVMLFQWGMSTRGSIPAVQQHRNRLVTANGRPVSEHDAAIWTLWMEVHPTP